MTLLDRLDRAVGTRVERAICAHHARRLRRTGWLGALDPPHDGPWAAGDPPPREGCSLEVLVDGEHALPPIAAASRLRGPVVADVGDHLRMRWHAVTGERLPSAPPPPPAGGQRVQLVRTVPEKVYDEARRGSFRILEAYVRALRSAERLVYLEN